MAVNDMKQTLIDEFMTYKSDDSKYVDSLISRIDKYLVQKEDTDLMLILCVLKTHKADRNNEGLEKCYALASPIFETLTNVTKWQYFHFWVLSCAIANHPNLEKTLEFLHEALDIIADEHTHDARYKSIVACFHGNMTRRILHAMYFDRTFPIQKLKALFERSYNHVMEVCIKKDLPQQYQHQARRGLIENNLELIESSMESLEKLGHKKKLKDIKNEVAEYLQFFPQGDLTLELSKLFFGYQLEKIMKENNVSATDLAAALDTDYNTITSTIRGKTGVSLQRLYKIADYFGVGVGYFAGEEDCKPIETDPVLLKIKGYLTDVDDSFKHDALRAIKLLYDIKYPGRGQKGYKSASNSA